MTQTTSSIKNSWSLISFARAFGKMAVGPCVNHETGETFNACSFTNGDIRTFVSFSSNLGKLTPKEIAEQKDTLQVVQLESGKYKLCRQGNNLWNDVDLGI